MATIRTAGEFKLGSRHGVRILMFHKIGESPASANMPWNYVSPAHFGRLLAEFKRRNAQSISLSDAVQTKTGIGNRFVISWVDPFRLGRFSIRGRLFRSLSSYKLSYLPDDLKSAARRAQRAGRRLLGRAYRSAFSRGNDSTRVV